MLPIDTAESTELFVGSPYFSLENADFREMTREWMRRQIEESAARLSCPLRQFVNPVDWPQSQQLSWDSDPSPLASLG
jgi:hypothetical protein